MSWVVQGHEFQGDWVFYNTHIDTVKQNLIPCPYSEKIYSGMVVPPLGDSPASRCATT